MAQAAGQVLSFIRTYTHNDIVVHFMQGETIMSSPGRKMARQVKRTTPEAKETAKQEQAERKESALNQDASKTKQTLASGYKPMSQVRQRRAGNS